MSTKKTVIERLKNPTTLLSILVQIIGILILLGVKIDEEVAITVIGMCMSILASLGLLTSKTSSDGIETAMMVCAKDGKKEPHILINGQMVCANCGSVNTEA